MSTSFRVGFVSLAMLLGQSGMMAQPQAPNGQPPYQAPYGQATGQTGPADGSETEAQDVPGRGVARISLLNGDVNVRRGDSGDVIAAAVNAPLVASDRLLTGPGARAELQLDGANRLRVNGDADLRLAEIEYRRYTVELGRGTLTWHVAKNSAADLDISTPSVSIRPVQPGDYRITVNADGTTEVTARTGEAEIYSPKGVERVRRGRTTLVRGDRNDPEMQTIAELREDDWDHFNVARDRELDRSESRQYLPDDVVGAEELDNNGTWVDSAPYGRVWQPRVAAGWSPYSQGRWVWLDYYGWSWVSYDQFGWAPFHYGSWFYQSTGWCWYPGARQTRTWWRPAMVAWFGFGGVRVGVGFGNWGWVPLAPFERFRPWYGRGFYGNNRTNIYNNIRVVNNYNIVNNYRNARVDGGARSIEAGQFGRSGGRYDRVGEANLRSAGLMQGQLPASPGRESLAFNDRRVNDAAARGGYQGAFYNRRPAMAQERIPFAEQQRGIEQGARAFGGDPSMRGGGVRSESARDSGIRGDAGVRSETGWRRVGERPNTGASDAVRGGDNGVRGNGSMRGDNSGATKSRSGQNESNGWRRFGEPSTRTAESTDAVRGGGRGGAIGNPNPGGFSSAGTGREVDPAVRGGASGGNGWRRFGEPSSSSSSMVESSGTRGSQSQGSGEAVRGGREYGRGDRGNNSVDRNLGYGNGYGTVDAVRGNGSPNYRRTEAAPEPSMPPQVQDPSFGSTRSGSANRSDSIRVNPPVLRDRSDSGSRGGGNVGGNPYRSVPSYGGAAPNGGGGGFSGGMRGGGGHEGSGGMRGGGAVAPSGGNSSGSRGGEGGGHRGGGGRRVN